MPKIAQQWLKYILGCFYKNRTLTRGQIIQATALNPASLSHALRHLIQRGAVLKLGELESGSGRRRDLLRLNADAGYFVAIDLEGTRIRFALTNLIGDICCRWEEPFRHGQPLEMSKIRHGMDMVMANLKEGQLDRVISAGLSYPGLMDKHGRLTAVNLGWNKFPLVEELRQACPFPVFMQPDADTCVEAESSHGQAQNVKNWIFVIIENGIGVGISIHGRTVHVGGFLGGELGHCTIDAAAPDQCACGKRGCLEAIASSPNIVRQYLEKSGTDGRHRDLSVTSVFDRARSGDPAALSVIDRAARALGLGLSHLVNLLSPQRIILGGDVLSGEDLLVPIIREEILRHALPDLANSVELSCSRLGLDIRLRGAASLAFRRSLDDPALLEKICTPPTLVPRSLELAIKR